MHFLVPRPSPWTGVGLLTYAKTTANDKKKKKLELGKA